MLRCRPTLTQTLWRRYGALASLRSRAGGQRCGRDLGRGLGRPSMVHPPELLLNYESTSPGLGRLGVVQLSDIGFEE